MKETEKTKKLESILDLLLDLINLYFDIQDKFIIKQARSNLKNLRG